MFEKRKAYASMPKKVNMFFQIGYFMCIIVIITVMQSLFKNQWLMIGVSSAATLVFTFIVWFLFPRYSLFGTKMSEEMRIKDKLIEEEIKRKKANTTKGK